MCAVLHSLFASRVCSSLSFYIACARWCCVYSRESLSTIFSYFFFLHLLRLPWGASINKLKNISWVYTQLNSICPLLDYKTLCDCVEWKWRMEWKRRKSLIINQGRGVVCTANALVYINIFVWYALSQSEFLILS